MNKDSTLGARIMCLRTLLAAILLTGLSGMMSIAQAQDVGAVTIHAERAGAGPVTAHAEGMDVEPIKGAPFCATVTTEHRQTFADGNRIHTSDSSNICRDSQGRTRRDASLNLLAAAPQSPLPKLITITDPVTGFRYTLDSENKIAHRFAINSAGAKGGGFTIAGPGAGPKGEHVMIYQRVGTVGPNMVVNDNVVFRRAGQPSDEAAPTTESLGDQTIDGIHATGTRMTTTIPAGRMGNEQPILVTSERWYSAELKAMIMTKHTDPWAGELKTQFTNVNRSEPDSSLFQVSGEYKIVDEKAGPFITLAPPPPPQ